MRVILIGMSGCGKTTIGHQLAALLKVKYIDIDQKIEAQQGKSITEIFAQIGESGFRLLESEALDGLEEYGVISTGGGVILNPCNMEKLRKLGKIVFLNRNIDLIANSVNRESRPLLSKDSGKLYELYKKRLPLYRKYADFIVENNGRMVRSVEKIVGVIKE